MVYVNGARTYTSESQLGEACFFAFFYLFLSSVLQAGDLGHNACKTIKERNEKKKKTTEAREPKPPALTISKQSIQPLLGMHLPLYQGNY